MGASGNYLTGCLCFDLRTGSLIIGVLSLIVSCGGILAMVVLGILELLYRVIDNQLDADQQFTCGSECTTVVVLSVMFFSEVGFHLIAASLMIHGVRKNRSGLMYPYFYWGIYSTIMYVTYAVVMESVFEAAFRTVVVHYISAALKICFVTVVRSYQQQLVLANNGKTGLIYHRLI